LKAHKLLQTLKEKYEEHLEMMNEEEKQLFIIKVLANLSVAQEELIGYYKKRLIAK
jgi:hypothetical protein